MSAVKNAIAIMEEASQAERAYFHNPAIHSKPFADLCQIKMGRLRYDANRLASIAIGRCSISTNRRNAAELRQIAAVLEMSAGTLREEAARLENGHA